MVGFGGYELCTCCLAKARLIPRRCPGISAALKSENMHLFYASLEIAVLATIEAIRLVIQIPLRTK
jgi:predicted amidophosphoribosyltransferase